MNVNKYLQDNPAVSRVLQLTNRRVSTPRNPQDISEFQYKLGDYAFGELISSISADKYSNLSRTGKDDMNPVDVINALRGEHYKNITTEDLYNLASDLSSTNFDNTANSLDSAIYLANKGEFDRAQGLLKDYNIDPEIADRSLTNAGIKDLDKVIPEYNMYKFMKDDPELLSSMKGEDDSLDMFGGLAPSDRMQLEQAQRIPMIDAQNKVAEMNAMAGMNQVVPEVSPVVPEVPYDTGNMVSNTNLSTENVFNPIRK